MVVAIGDYSMEARARNTDRMSRNKKPTSQKLSREIAHNRRARFDYHFEARYEAGLMLEGWEVKSIRAGQLQLANSYVGEIKGALYLLSAHISPLPTAQTYPPPDPERARKLLLHGREMAQIISAIREKNRTCVCISAHWHQGKVKADIAVATGKKQHDKRATQRDRDWSREKQRINKGSDKLSG